jgi:hypothetical protein
MRRKKGAKIKSKSKGLSKRRPVTDLVIGALLANVGSKLLSRVTKDMVPMGNIITPAAVAIAANILRPPYAEGMVVGGALTAVSEAIRSYAPAQIKDLLAGEDQYIIQGSESADPLLGAQYLLGESEQVVNPLDNTDFVISGAANDPLD